MENRELIKEYLSKFDGKYNEEDTTYGFWDVQCIMDLARADEREKMQGVDVWISRDDYENSDAIFSSHKPHSEILGGVLYYNSGLYGFEDAIGLQPGQCRKFKIVECGND